MPTLAEIMARKAGAGKPAPAQSGGIKITPESEKSTLAANIKRTLDASAPKPAPPLPHSDKRELGAMTEGERIPMDHPPADAPAKEWQWFDAMHSFSSDLGIVLEPEGDHAWLAVKANPIAPPLLLHRFPILNRETTGNPF